MPKVTPEANHMSSHVAYKRGKKNNWIKSSFGAGLCFNLSYDHLEQLLKNHNMRMCKLTDSEQIVRVEIGEHGIAVFIEPITDAAR